MARSPSLNGERSAMHFRSWLSRFQLLGWCHWNTESLGNMRPQVARS